MQREISVKGDAFFKIEVRACEIADDFLSVALGERDVDDGGLATELGVDDFEGAGAGLGTAQEIDMKS